jgi:peptide/nickel transport system permease protein
MSIATPLGTPRTVTEAAPTGTLVRSTTPRVFRQLLRKPIATASLVVLVGIVVVCVLAPLVAPYSPVASDFTAILQGPSRAHLLGTDELGRDILSRLLYGGRPTLLAAGLATLIASLLGTLLGVVAGYRRGWIDRGLSLWGDLLLAMPVLVVLIVVISVFPSSPYPAMIPLGIILSAAPMRVLRSVTLSVREELFIDAARVNGLSHREIMLRHVLPRIRGPLVVQATLVAAVSVIIASSLAFLGFGVQVPAASWGSMVAEAASEYQQQPWFLVPTGGVIALTVLCLGLLGDGVRDVVADQWSGVGAAATTRRRARAVASRADAAPPAEATVLSVRDLTVRVEARGGSTVLVDGVSFDLRRGRTLAIVGESGCGKSMTARALLGVAPDGCSVSGSARLDGEELIGASRAVLRGVHGRRIALIGQEPVASFDPTQTIGASLREVIRHHRRLNRRAADAQVLSLLARVGIRAPERVVALYPHQVSGGMAQRAAIARALAGEPEVIVADEPTTALDVTVQARILAVLRTLQTTSDIAVLLITHDWGVVAALADEVLVMYAGHAVETGEAEPVFHRPLHPYTEALLRSDPHRTILGEPLAVIPGAVPTPGSWPTGCRFAPRCRHASPACVDAPIPLVDQEKGRRSRCIHVDELVATS